jgi:hypothetical protein
VEREERPEFPASAKRTQAETVPSSTPPTVGTPEKRRRRGSGAQSTCADVTTLVSCAQIHEQDIKARVSLECYLLYVPAEMGRASLKASVVTAVVGDESGLAQFSYS